MQQREMQQIEQPLGVLHRRSNNKLEGSGPALMGLALAEGHGKLGQGQRLCMHALPNVHIHAHACSLHCRTIPATHLSPFLLLVPALSECFLLSMTD